MEQVPISTPVTINFSNEADIVKAREMAFAIASAMGFDKTGCAEATLAVSEIVGNAVKLPERVICLYEYPLMKES